MKSEAAPSALVNGDALRPEHLDTKMHTASLKAKKLMSKKKKAEEAFNMIKNQEGLVGLVMEKFPELNKHQATAIAKVLSLKHLEKSEKLLEKIAKKTKA
jgi:pyoverdine/dityrosine biosynthesis protein Dit1